MLHDDTMLAFKQDVLSSEWKDTLNTCINKCKNHKLIIAEYKANGYKVQVTKDYGICFLFMKGNKILEKYTMLDIILHRGNHFENQISDFMGISFGQGREIYRSLVSNAINHFRV